MSAPSTTDGSGYLIPRSPATAELKERGSRFLAELIPIGDDSSAGAAIEEARRRHHKATHHCWARRTGWPPVERSADDGEPAGTAGAPILQVMRGAAVSDALIVVTRWFGGVKLGRGGLARAYGGAAQSVLAVAELERHAFTVVFRLTTPWDRVGAIRGLLSGFEAEVLQQEFGETVAIEAAVEQVRADAFEAACAELRPAVAFERMAPVV